MIENYRSGLVWQLMRQCPYIKSGLRRAGFTGGWLTGDTEHLGLGGHVELRNKFPVVELENNEGSA